MTTYELTSYGRKRLFRMHSLVEPFLGVLATDTPEQVSTTKLSLSATDGARWLLRSINSQVVLGPSRRYDDRAGRPNQAVALTKYLSDHYNDHMTRIMTATEVKAKILDLLDQVDAGNEIEITKHGRIVARLVPARGPHALRGKFAGLATSAVTDEALYSTGLDWDLP